MAVATTIGTAVYVGGTVLRINETGGTGTRWLDTLKGTDVLLLDILVE